MPRNESRKGTERPDGWPEMFLKPSANCNHLYHWDTEQEAYKCIYCERIQWEPPEENDD